MGKDVIKDISKRMARACKELYSNGLVRGASGNISSRIPGTDMFLIKPSGAHMKLLKPEELVLVDLQGNKIRGKAKVSMDTPIHTAIYRARTDVQAVVHTHAPIATAFGITKTEILPLQVETFALLQNGVPIVPFEPPGSKSLAEAVQKKITDYNAVILENHGIITVGSTIEAACDLNEIVEEAAKIQLLAVVLASRDSVDLAKLKEKFKIQNSRK